MCVFILSQMQSPLFRCFCTLLECQFTTCLSSTAPVLVVTTDASDSEKSTPLNFSYLHETSPCFFQKQLISPYFYKRLNG